jgi:hypothetical protein
MSFFFFTTLFLITPVLSQHTIIEIKGGALFPADSETGFIVGLSGGRMVDENIGWSIGADYYWRTYTKESTVNIETGPTTQETIVIESENATKMLPLLAKLSYLTQIGSNLDVRISGGLGYAFLWNKEANYQLDVESSDNFSGFAWEIGAGVSIPISRAADFYGELNYFSSTPSKDEGETPEGLPKRTEIDMSGFLFRIGIRLYN